LFFCTTFATSPRQRKKSSGLMPLVAYLSLRKGHLPPYWQRSRCSVRPVVDWESTDFRDRWQMFVSPRAATR
jgi:hypothetical protein